MGQLRRTVTSVTNYYSTLHKIPEERRYLLHRGGSLKWRSKVVQIVCKLLNIPISGRYGRMHDIATASSRDTENWRRHGAASGK